MTNGLAFWRICLSGGFVLSQEHAAIHAALGLKPGEGGGLGRTFTPEPTILQELQLVEERIAGPLFTRTFSPCSASCCCLHVIVLSCCASSGLVPFAPFQQYVSSLICCTGICPRHCDGSVALPANVHGHCSTSLLTNMLPSHIVVVAQSHWSYMNSDTCK